MKQIADHHHYKKERIYPTDRVALYERYVVNMLLESKLTDEFRDSSIAFELKHHHSTAQFARVLSRKRNLPVDVCTVGALLHDIYVAKSGKYENHAHKSADLASSILDEVGEFSADEKEQILLIVSNHSDKDIWTDNPFVEFGKDVDILDSFLYPNAFGYYLKHKRVSVFFNYVIRAKKIWDELGIPQPKDFSIFDNYKMGKPWLDFKEELRVNEAKTFLTLVCHMSDIETIEESTPPTMVFHSTDSKVFFYTNSKSCKIFHAVMPKFNVAGNNSSVVEEMLTISKQAYILVWAAIDAYEILTPTTSISRLNELGIKANL